MSNSWYTSIKLRLRLSAAKPNIQCYVLVEVFSKQAVSEENIAQIKNRLHSCTKADLNIANAVLVVCISTEIIR